MSKAPGVSVIVPAYCHEYYIVDCLTSIHDQNYENIEVVVIDDQSSDDTFGRVEALFRTMFARRFTNTVLLRNETNQGAHNTINRGIAAASNEFIAVINSDDLFYPDRIGAMVDALRSSGSELCFTLIDVMADDISAHDIPEDFRLFGMRQWLDSRRDPTIGFSLLRRNIAVSTGNLMFKRSLFDRIGRFVDLKYCHDWDFVLQSLYYCEPVLVPEPLYGYRLHPTNSFAALGGLARIETEVVLRRFFRRGLFGRSENKLAPTPYNWPGYFQLFIEECGYQEMFGREDGRGGRGWRTYSSLSEATADPRAGLMWVKE